jgi:hypothetical protein
VASFSSGAMASFSSGADRRQAGPDRVCDQPLPGPVLRLSTSSGRCPSAPSMAAPGRGRISPSGCGQPTGAPHGIRYFHGCYALAVDQLWASPASARAAATPGRAQVDPGRSARRLPSVRYLGRPVGEQEPGDPPLDRGRQRRALSGAGRCAVAPGCAYRDLAVSNAAARQVA